MKINENEAHLRVDIGSNGQITAQIEPKRKIDVVVGNAAKMDCEHTINYIKSGKSEIDSAVQDGISDFNQNVAIKEDEINAYVGIAKQWAIGDPSEPVGYSAKYWADEAATTVSNMADKDLSNLSLAGEAKFSAKQDVISDLSTMRTGAGKGATAVQPADLARVATTGSYTDLSNKPTIPTVNDATLTITQGGVSKGTFTANAASDVTIDLDSGGASRNIGEIVASTIPLTDAGLHLLDGSLISGAGSYADFVTYIADLYDSGDYTAMFETEENWQAAVLNFGVCGKFVYDSVNNTVRLPKITGFTESTVDVTKVGDLVEAGLPNITGNVAATNWEDTANNTGAFSTNDSKKASVSNRDYSRATASFDASRSSSIYGNSTTVQPQSIKVLYYVVIATTTKTQIEVDIDEIVTDLNGKADIDLSNCTKPHVVETYQNGADWYRIWSDGWCEQGGYNTATETTRVINLLKIMSDTNYFVVIQEYHTSANGDNVPIINPNTKTTSSFTCYPSTRYVGWYVCGYIG